VELKAKLGRMDQKSSPSVLAAVRRVSFVAIALTIVASQIMAFFGHAGTSSWQVWLAVVALAVGIPHGALDHLVTVPGMKLWPMARFVVGYLAVTALALAAILLWPVAGFIGVVVMSAVHFGMGDASFTRQVDPTAGSLPTPWWVYAIPAGALPVVVPLTNAEAANALALVNPDLVGWHFGFDGVLMWGVLIVGAIAIVWLVAARKFADARDLVALGLLALLTPPLVAFAAYFGLWHALRHTARLSIEYPPAHERVEHGEWVRGLWTVTLPGTPALVGTMLIAAVLAVIGFGSFDSYLWFVLALIWALTVPHMALTWRLDNEVLSQPVGQSGGHVLSAR